MSKLRKITHTAVIIAVALALRNFSFLIPFAGTGGMRIDVSVFFSKLPALLLGPFFGGVADGVIDFLAATVVKPEGAYLFPLTVTAVLGGIIAGFLWKSIKNINTRIFGKVFITLFSLVGIWGIINLISVRLAPGAAYSQYLISFGKRTEYLTVWFIAAGIIGGAIFLLDVLFGKSAAGKTDFIKVLAVLLIANITVTTINTVLLMYFFPALAKLGFVVFYIPRLIQEIISTVLQSFVISYFIKLYKRIL